jgi:hypothetical protein
MDTALEADEDRLTKEPPDSPCCRDFERGLGVDALEDMGEAEELRKEEEAEDEAESTDMESELVSMPESVEFFRSSDMIRGAARGVASPRCL